MTAALACLPHRFSMRLLDRIEYSSVTAARGHISANEPWFSGTTSDFPKMLIIESMAQLAGFLVISPIESGRRVVVLVGIFKARFTGSAFPCDRLETEATLFASARRSRVGLSFGRDRRRSHLFGKIELWYS